MWSHTCTDSQKEVKRVSTVPSHPPPVLPRYQNRLFSDHILCVHGGCNTTHEDRIKNHTNLLIISLLLHYFCPLCIYFILTFPHQNVNVLKPVFITKSLTYFCFVFLKYHSSSRNLLHNMMGMLIMCKYAELHTGILRARWECRKELSEELTGSLNPDIWAGTAGEWGAEWMIFELPLA